MATIQNFLLFEHSCGYALFLVKQFDEISRSFSSHPNSFLKILVYVPFRDIDEATENLCLIQSSQISNLLDQILTQNIPSKDAVLMVSEETLGKNIKSKSYGFEVIWTSVVNELTRIVRANFAKLTKGLLIQPGGTSNFYKHLINSNSSAIEITKFFEPRARLTVALAKCKKDLNLSKFLCDTGVIKVLKIFDDMTDHLNNAVTKLRFSYKIHFPELLKLIPHKEFKSLLIFLSSFPNRKILIEKYDSSPELQLALPRLLIDSIIKEARESLGQDISDEDCENFITYAQRLTRLLEVCLNWKHNFQAREKCFESLKNRVAELTPNLSSLFNSVIESKNNDYETNPSILAARLISRAGNLDRLAMMPSSRLLSLGASKSLFRRSGAVIANSQSILSTAVKETSSLKDPRDLPSVQLKADTVRKHTARLLSSKATLAARADCFKTHNPVLNVESEFGGDYLEFGKFGEILGKDVTKQLRVWSESQGLHIERTVKISEEKRKKLKAARKKKHTKWLKRKLARNAAPIMETSRLKPALREFNLEELLVGDDELKELNLLQSPTGPIVTPSGDSNSKPDVAQQDCTMMEIEH